MRIAIALGSAAIAVVTLLAVSQSPAQAEFYRTPAGEVKYRWVNPNANNTHLFYYRGYAYPYRLGPRLPRAHRRTAPERRAAPPARDALTATRRHRGSSAAGGDRRRLPVVLIGGRVERRAPAFGLGDDARAPLQQRQRLVRDPNRRVAWRPD